MPTGSKGFTDAVPVLGAQSALWYMDEEDSDRKRRSKTVLNVKHTMRLYWPGLFFHISHFTFENCTFQLENRQGEVRTILCGTMALSFGAEFFFFFSSVHRLPTYLQSGFT